MIIEASLILAFVGYMWWKSQPLKSDLYAPKSSKLQCESSS